MGSVRRWGAHCATQEPVALSSAWFVLFYLAADWLDCPRCLPCVVSHPSPQLVTDVRTVVINGANQVMWVQSRRGRPRTATVTRMMMTVSGLKGCTFSARDKTPGRIVGSPTLLATGNASATYHKRAANIIPCTATLGKFTRFVGLAT